MENVSDKEPLIWEGTYDEEKLKADGKEIVRWPDSQLFIDHPDFAYHSWLINDCHGQSVYGSSAYVVESAWIDARVKEVSCGPYMY